MNSLTHFIDGEGQIRRKPAKEGKRKKSRKRKVSKVGKVGIVRLYGKDLEKLRRECFERDGYRCQYRLWIYDAAHGYKAVGWKHCLLPVTWETGQMAHIRTKRNNGDTLENVRTLCATCHAKEHNAGGKPCPAKPIQGQ